MLYYYTEPLLPHYGLTRHESLTQNESHQIVFAFFLQHVPPMQPITAFMTRVEGAFAIFGPFGLFDFFRGVNYRIIVLNDYRKGFQQSSEEWSPVAGSARCLAPLPLPSHRSGEFPTASEVQKRGLEIAIESRAGFIRTDLLLGQTMLS